MKIQIIIFFLELFFPMFVSDMGASPPPDDDKSVNFLTSLLTRLLFKFLIFSMDEVI